MLIQHNPQLCSSYLDFIREEPAAIELVPIVTAVCTNYNRGDAVANELLAKSLMQKYWTVLEEHVGNISVEKKTALNNNLGIFLTLVF